MAEDTIRDRLWSCALNHALRRGEAIYPEDLAERYDVSERTARDCLNSIARANFLLREAMPDGRIRYRTHPDFDIYRGEMFDKKVVVDE